MIARKNTLSHRPSYHERSGDLAMQRGSYGNAAQHYVDAIALPDFPQRSFRRILGKLYSAFFMGPNPNSAGPWLEIGMGHLPEAGGGSLHRQNADASFETLRQAARQLWLDARTREALDLIAKTGDIAQTSSDQRTYRRCRVLTVKYLHLMGRYDEAFPVLSEIAESDACNDRVVRNMYCESAAQAAAVDGDAATVHKYFQDALVTAKRTGNVYDAIVFSINYAECLIALGEIQVAQAQVEDALALARRQRVTWRIPQLCLVYAELLLLVGKPAAAHRYVREALSYDSVATIVGERIANVGIPVSLQSRDSAMLRRCTIPSMLPRAFQSGDAQRIAQSVASFAELYARRGEVRRARELLNKALPFIQRPDYSWEFLVAVARYGGSDDRVAARRLIERRTRLPRANVAQACLAFFDAIIAHGAKKSAKAEQTAVAACKQFEQLGWHGYAAKARSLLPLKGDADYQMGFEPRHRDAVLSSLSRRRRQVANLVMQGYSNQAIASALLIKKRTVESHITTIMKGLAIRSRHQLQDILSSNDKPGAV